MYTIEKYKKDTLSLSNSIVFKLNAVADICNIQVQMNSNYVDKYKPNNDKSNWKYYLNLAGIPHPLDKPTYIKTIETGTDEILTAELLLDRNRTRDALLENAGYYREQLSRYPDRIRYIHGCMYPVPLSKSISAQDGDILTYNEAYVEDNERYLIPTLQKHLKLMLSRWYNEKYTETDELYLAGIYGVAYAFLYNKIFNIRLSKIHTNEVHSFHLENFFRSKLDIWDDIKILNKESIFWLYKNIDRLIKNTGNHGVLSEVIENVFSKNKIGIGEYNITRDDPVLKDNPYNTSDSSYVKKDPTVITDRLNEDYVLNYNRTKSVEDTILEELSNNQYKLPANFRRHLIRTTTNFVNKHSVNDEITKILDIDSSEIFKKQPLDLFELTIDNWIYAIYRDLMKIGDLEYKGNVHISNKEIDAAYLEKEEEIVTSDNRVYKTTPIGGLFMLLKLFLFANKELDKRLTCISFNKAIDINREEYMDIVNNKLFDDGYSKMLLTKMYDYIPYLPKSFNTRDELKIYLDKLNSYAAINWLVDTNTENGITQASIKALNAMLYKSGTWEFSKEPKTIDQLLREMDINFVVSYNVDIVATMKVIIKTFTGVELDHEDIIISNMDKYVRILNKLTSYTVHTLSGASIKSNNRIYYNMPTVLKMVNGLVMTYGTELEALEDIPYELKALNNVSPDRMQHVKYDLIGNIQRGVYTKYLGGFSMDERIPDIMDMNQPHLYSMNTYDKYNDWLRVQAMEIKSLEETNQRLNSFIEITDRGVTKWIPLNANEAMRITKDIQGEMIMSPKDYLCKLDTMDFETFPLAWYIPSLDNFVNTSGMYLETLENTDKKLITEDYTLGTPKVINYNNDDTSDIHKLVSPRGTAYQANMELQTMSFNAKHELLDFTGIGGNYIRVGMMGFKSLEDPKDIINYILPKESSNFVKTDTGVVLSRDKTTDTNSEILNVTGDKINKDFVTGLASLPYKINTDQGSEIRQLSHIGLVNTDGILEVYDTNDIGKVDIIQLKSIPSLDITDDKLMGTSCIIPTPDKNILSNTLSMHFTTGKPNLKSYKLLRDLGYTTDIELDTSNIEDTDTELTNEASVNREVTRQPVNIKEMLLANARTDEEREIIMNMTEYNQDN